MKALQNAAIWLLIAAAVALIVLVASSDHATVGRALNAADDSRTGAKFRPTPDQIDRARESARRRRED